MAETLRSDIKLAGLENTFEERLKIGFSQDVESWRHSEAVFDEHTLKIEDHPVMEDWERGYMKELADVVSQRGGVILEVGYGMGISASFIQANKVDRHVIIEANNGVYDRLLDFQKVSTVPVSPHNGFWQEVVTSFGDASFDGILFDTYPLTKEEVHGNHFPFFNEAHRLLKPGGVFTYYSDEPVSISDFHHKKLIDAGFSNVDFRICKVTPPTDCQYWKHPTIVVPIITR